MNRSSREINSVRMFLVVMPPSYSRGPRLKRSADAVSLWKMFPNVGTCISIFSGADTNECAGVPEMLPHMPQIPPMHRASPRMLPRMPRIPGG